MKKNRNKLVWRNGRWFENGRWLQKKDYIFHASSSEGETITSCVTGQLYRMSGDPKVSYC